MATDNEDTKKPETQSVELYLKEVVRIHDRFDDIERRMVRVEDRVRGTSVADPMQTIMLWMAIAYIVSALAPPLLDMLRSKSCNAQQ